MIRLQNLSLRRGTKLLLEDVNLTLHAGNRVGLTGANGCGKSSLLALLRGELTVDAGDLELPSHLAIAHVAQETPALEKSAIDHVIDGDHEFRLLESQLAEAEQANNGEQLGLLHGKIDAIGGYAIQSRAGQLLHGLGFTAKQQLHPVSSFSGGWRMRLNLAQALLCRSDLLLLDEPTNHLDLEAVLWLEQWLKVYSGTLLLISHDRDFLDSVCSHITHIEHQRANSYTGNYSDFERQRAARLIQQQSAFEKQQRERAHMESFIRRFKAKATKAKQAQSRIKALERMEVITAAHIDSPFHFVFREPEKQPNPLLQLNKVDFGYAEQPPIFKQLNINLAPGSRLALLGPNGAGKSTLIKLLCGELAATIGERKAHDDLKLGYFAQHQLELLDPQASALLHVQRLDPKAREQDIRDFLGGFNFRGEQADSPVAPFSGGEKARLVLAMLVYQKPNLLLLDEPTNHLDLEMRHALTMALQDYPGALVLVSHDRHLLRTVADELYLVDSQALQPFTGDLEDYQRWLTERNREQAAAEKAAESDGLEKSASSAANRKEQRKLDAEKRKSLKPLQDKLKKAEKRLDQVNELLDQAEAELAKPEIYDQTNKAKLAELLQQQGSLKSEQEQLEESWMELTDQLEEMV
ncbi:ATP-binding cassette domain-containing protein [Pelagibaculum spongiae]|uniref:Probable ATP-binding protein YheS n=1 Tax=Pelagibaculum spongiae TaxID=2080658 RepID=A0A2V1GRJ3_9GAMM|nr:ATP-binding cassette domain-containing protein [Pelagibaculum spongiae]PVZ63929.1 ABC transporter ATP-binding protein [Pelagibaculum spongiae]